MQSNQTLKRKKVVIFEDNDSAIQKMRLLENSLQHKFEFIFLEYPDDIRAWIEENDDFSDIELFVCDYDIYGEKGSEFVSMIREKGFNGKMLANSSDYNSFLMEAGCNLENPTNKDLKVIKDILNNSDQEARSEFRKFLL